MRPLAHSFLVFSALMLGLAGQDQGKLAARDAELTRMAVSELHAVADAFAAEKQHRRALQVRREIWMDYDPTDKRAREKCGFVPVGDAWRVDINVLVLDRDLKGKKSKIKKVERNLAKLQQKLLTGHRTLAALWTKAGAVDQAAGHWRHVLRYAPDDKKAVAALALAEFDGFRGTASELAMLRRGRAIHLACDWLNRHEFAVQELEDKQLPLLEAAGLEHAGVQSEFYQVWGTLPVEDLEIIARDCERALLLARAIFRVSTGEVFTPSRIRHFVFVKDQAQYSEVLNVCAEQFTADRLAFLRDAVDMCFLDHGGLSLRVHKADMGMAVSRDQAVRGVMQDAIGAAADGLWEGLGHAACGFLFGQTLTFMEEQLTDVTAASHARRRLAPDLETWMQIATESAWSKSDTRTSELVLLKAARFTNEQRVKAWAICHYFSHWHPEYLLQLNDSKTEVIRTPPDIEREFLRRTGYELPRIDSEWRTFWARGKDLRAAMTRAPLPDEKAKNFKAVERSRSLVDAINSRRAEARIGPAGYHLAQSPDFLAVRAYERALLRAEKEEAKRRKKAKGKKFEPVTYPEPPAAIGQSVLFSREDAADDAVRAWLKNPRFRDRLLAPGRDLFGVPKDRGGFLVSIADPEQSTVRGGPLVWPREGQVGVDGQARLAELDDRARRALRAAGASEDAPVGMPMSLHFGRSVDLGAVAQIKCSVFVRNVPVEGVLVRYDSPLEAQDGSPACPAVGGLIAFIPLQPLPSEQACEVRWDLPQSLLGRAKQADIQSFVVR